MTIPAQGIIRIYPGSINTLVGNWSVSGNATGVSPLANQATLEAYYATRLDAPLVAPRMQFIDEIPAASGHFVPTNATYAITFDPDTSAIVFDPSGVNESIDFLSASFPMGLTIDQLTVKWNGAWTTGPARNRQLSDVLLKYFGATVLTTTPSPGTTFDGDLQSGTFTIIPFLTKWSPLRVFKQFGFSTSMSSVVSVLLSDPQFRNDLCYLEGVYNTAFFGQTATADALPGNLVEITGTSLDAFSAIKLYWDDPTGTNGLSEGLLIPSSHILTFTPVSIRFIIPTNEDVPYGGKRLMVTGVGNGTFFVGEFPIANLNVTLVDGSGLYKLTADQPYDTYYDRGTTPVTTVNLKIP
jgi:hypothetical protein